MRTHVDPCRRGGLLLVCALAAVGCGDLKPLPTDPEGGEPPATATLARVQAEVFTPACALPGCHAGTAPQAGLELTAGLAYAEIVGVPATQRPDLARVEPGDPEDSYLVKKLRGDPDIVGSAMPLTGAISGEQFQLVVDWVRRGAPND